MPSKFSYISDKSMRAITTNAYFEDIGFQIQQELMKAKESVKICVAWIRWQKYAPIFDQLTRRGISVEVIYNDDYLNRRYFQAPLHSTTLYPVRARHGALMHNKFCIIDDSKIITGSFNWSRNAGRHFENLVVIEHDFRLVKSFLTEFQDLKNYFSEFAQNNKIQCLSNYDYNQCRASSYNLGILGHESGKYDDSLIEIWNICLTHDHGTLLGEHHENHLHSYLGLKYESDYDQDIIYDKQTMLSEVTQEFEKTAQIKNHFISRSKHPIHAIGSVSLLNANEHLEWDEQQEFGINIFWRDMYYRKVIPDIIYDDDYGFINSIIRNHR
ncbi:phospholipase D-like domain-containing protein [Achromobacter sp. ESBL13]|uniref:phospholipase D-like domain-containing protein n=1 Tax=Achromobacter sp. ESBL13 TaxID=3077328 RepID=UPI002FCB723B